jgi:putative copper resistance protein D
MTGFIDVLLRGALLVAVALAVGGVAWARLVLRAEPHAKPDAAVARCLRAVAAGGWLAAATQGAIVLLVLADVAGNAGHLPLGEYLATSFARMAIVRAMLAAGLAMLAGRLARRAAGPTAWGVLAALAVAVSVSSAGLSHAAARVDGRLLLLALDAAHQLAASVWVGGLAHFTLHVARGRARGEDDAHRGVIAPRFSTLALVAMSAIVTTGLVLTLLYVGDLAGMIGTAYGVMILSKVALLLAVLGLAGVNFRLVRRAFGSEPPPRLTRFVEVELGLGITILFAAASLTSLPPATDVRADRATPSEVAGRFVPAPPRLTSPPIAELIRTAEPLMAPVGERLAIERAWSEYNHHWAGVFVLAMGLLAALEGAGVRVARHWPLVFLGLAGFLFVRNDPRAWPLGPAGFWESMTLPDVLQHRAFVVLIVAFGIFEWLVRVGRLPARPWALVFPLLCAAGGGMLLTHSHAMFNLKDEFLTEVTHAPLGIVGAFAGWARWVEVRLPEAGGTPAWLWRACFVAVGVILLVYREA